MMSTKEALRTVAHGSDLFANNQGQDAYDKLEADARALWAFKVLDRAEERGHILTWIVCCGPVKKYALAWGRRVFDGESRDAARIAAAEALVAADPSLAIARLEMSAPSGFTPPRVVRVESRDGREAREALLMLQELRDLIVRMDNARERQTDCPPDSEIGAFHVVEENWSGYLQYTSERKLRYAGAGRWEIHPGSYTLWHAIGGSVYYWRDVPKSLRSRALKLIDEHREPPTSDESSPAEKP